MSLILQMLLQQQAGDEGIRLRACKAYSGLLVSLMQAGLFKPAICFTVH